jgi:hypothetical protein
MNMNYPAKQMFLFASSVQLDCRNGNLKGYDIRNVEIYNYCRTKAIQISGSHLVVTLEISGFNAVVSFYYLTYNSPIVIPSTRPPTQLSTRPPIVITTQPEVVITQCGIPAIKPNNLDLKIVGGNEAIPNSWPWQVIPFKKIEILTINTNQIFQRRLFLMEISFVVLH